MVVSVGVSVSMILPRRPVLREFLNIRMAGRLGRRFYVVWVREWLCV